MIYNLIRRLITIVACLLVMPTALLANTLTVAPSGGDFTSPLDAINSITDASASNRYVVFVKAGTYVVDQNMALKPFVTLRGEGPDLTSIKLYSANDGVTLTSVFLAGASSVEDLSITYDFFDFTQPLQCVDQAQRILIRNVNVSSGSGSSGAVGATFNNCRGIVIENSRFRAGGGDGSAVLIAENSVIVIRDSSLFGSESMISTKGISLTESVITMSRVKVSITNRAGLDPSVGIDSHSSSITANDLTVTVNASQPLSVRNSSSSVVINDVTITSVGSSGSGSPIGVSNIDSSPRITNGRITAASLVSDSVEGWGVLNTQSSRPTIENVQISVYGSNRNVGVENLDSSSVIVRNSFVSTSGDIRVALSNDETSNSKIFHSSVFGNTENKAGGISRFINTEMAGTLMGEGSGGCLNSFTPSLIELNRNCE